MTGPRSCKKPTFSHDGADIFHSGTDMITFLAGPRQQTFYLHKNYVCHYSPVLNAMFNGVWKESAARKVVWPEYSPEMLNMFQIWLYNQNLRGVLKEATIQTYDAIWELWLFADMYQLPKLQNDSMYLLIHVMAAHGLVMNISSLFRYYEQAPKNSGLRKLCCDRFSGDLVETACQYLRYSVWLLRIYCPGISFTTSLKC